MRRLIVMVSACTLAVAVLALKAQTPAPQTPPQAQAQPETPPVDMDLKLAEVTKSIAGQEKAPAETVFKNIQHFKGVPAGRIPLIMRAFSRALGVTCEHCHVVDQWDKDDKPKKPIARAMVGMVMTINGDLLKKIPNLKGPNPTVSCSTCHRGQVKPEINLPPSAKAN